MKARTVIKVKVKHRTAPRKIKRDPDKMLINNKSLTIEERAKMVKKQLIKSFAGSRGGFSKESLAAGGIFASSSINHYQP